MDVIKLNLWVAWIAMLMGALSGAAHGLFFRSDAWWGGYGSWRRRIARLGHIAFFGLAFVNIAFVASVHALGLTRGLAYPAYHFAAANFLMPAVCYLSAIDQRFARLFFLPVAAVLGGIGSFLLAMGASS